MERTVGYSECYVILQQNYNRATPELQQTNPLGPVSVMSCCKKRCNRATGEVSDMSGFMDSGRSISFGESGEEGRSVWGDECLTVVLKAKTS